MIEFLFGFFVELTLSIHLDNIYLKTFNNF
jgi:hypothetical protein